MIFPVRVLIGLCVLIATMPMVIGAMFFALAGNDDKADWLMDHAPIELWFNYLDGRR